MAGVAVTLSSASPASSEQTVVTDANGAYTFKDLPPGNYQVRFKKSAFKALEKDVALEAGKTFTAEVELLPEQSAASPGAATGTASTITGVATDTITKKPMA